MLKIKKILIVLFVSVFSYLFFTQTYAASVTVTLQEGLNGYTGSFDNEIFSGAATTTYAVGGSTYADRIGVKSNSTGLIDTSRALFRFTNIPLSTTTEITNIQLQIKKYASQSTNTYSAYAYKPTRADWVAGSVSWTNYKTSTAWTTAGGDIGSYIASTTMPASGNWLTLDLGTNYTLTEIEQNGILVRSSIYGFTWFYSNETATITNRPKLLITYTSDDATPPVVSQGSPSGQLSGTLTSTTMSVVTDEVATCKYSASSGTAYDSMTTFSTTGGTNHSTLITGLSNGNTYNYYVKCQDAVGNTSAEDYAITFIVGAPDTEAPSIPTNVTASAVSATQVNIFWTASTDNIRVTGYKIYRDGAQVGTTTSAVAYQDIGLQAETTYTYTVAAYDSAGNVSGTSASTTASTQSAASLNDPKVILTPALLASMRQKVADNTPQWQAFKNKLDTKLNDVINAGYQASGLIWISEYAFGYKLLETTDSVTAAKYANKALAIMKSGLRSYHKGGWNTRQYLARGDGVTKTFTLPNSDIVASSFKAYFAPISIVSVSHTAVDGLDNVKDYQEFIKVSNTPDGPEDYERGVDWQRNSDYEADWQQNAYYETGSIDWSLAGAEPQVGSSTYYVTAASLISSKLASGYTLNGNTLTFTTAPSASQGILVEYVYGSDYSQTYAHDGGFNSIYADSTYSSRYLGKHIAMGYDWLYDYPGFTSELKAEAVDLLVRWYEYIRDYGNKKIYPESNYGAGGYVSRTITAIALTDRHASSTQFLNEIVNYRQSYLIPRLTDETKSVKGGFWSEGWGYGALASENILLAALSLETSGHILATEERAWATDVIKHLVSAQSTSTTIYDGGDTYAYPLPFPPKSFMYQLANMTSSDEAKAYANYIVQHYPTANSEDYRDMLYRDLTATATFWSSLPLQHYATGTGFLAARSDWGNNPTWVSLQMGNLTFAGHQTNSPGQLQIQRGADMLLVNASAVGGSLAVNKSTVGNLILIDDNGDGAQTYRYSMGLSYGTPGITSTREASSTYVYMNGDYKAAYSKSTRPGAGGSATELKRQMIYLRPDYVVVYDKVGTVKDNYLKRLQWHFINQPTIDGDSFIATRGNSKLFGKTFSSESLTTALVSTTVSGTDVWQVSTKNTNATTSVRYVTALEVATSTKTTMATTTFIQSSDQNMEGVMLGNEVALFGKYGTVNAAVTPITYTVTATATIDHIITDLPAGENYFVQVNGETVASRTVSSEGTLTFSAASTGLSTITVSNTSTDTTPPDISAIATSSIATSSATITWTTSEGSNSQVEYGTSATYTASSTLSTSLATSHSVSLSGLLPSTTYHFRVLSSDSSGNTASSSDQTFTTLAESAQDTTEPTISITSPESGEILSGTVTFTASASDNVGVSGVSFYINNSLIGTEITSSPYTTTWNSATLADGYHTLVAVARDAAGNYASTSVMVTNLNVDNTAPTVIFSEPDELLDAGTTAATLSVTTNETAHCRYTTSPLQSYDTMTSFTYTGTSTIHALALSGLSDNSTYTYYVKCRDNADNTSADYSMTFTVGSDTTAPSISSVSSGTPDATEATVTWTTGENADSRVEYGLTSSYTYYSNLNTSRTTQHSILLTNLTPATTYHYRVQSIDAAGNASLSDDNTFTTASDSTAPVISSVSSGTPNSSSATIIWTTNELSDSQVNYGLTSSYTASSTLNSTLSLSHSTTLSNLAAGTTYHFRVRSTDAYGNISVSSDATFTTTSSVVSIGGGGGGGTSSPTPTPAATTQATTTLTVAALGCLPGARFNTQTGALCPTSIPSTPSRPDSPTSQPLTSHKFSRDLKLGMTHSDVKALQQFLNRLGYTVAKSGSGSKGKESTYFGPATQTALIKFQKAHNISPASGFFGPLTRNYITGEIPMPPKVTPVTPAPAASSQPITRTLSRGMRGNDVKLLQRILKVEQTGYFGALTETAVKNFQRTHNIAKAGTSGYGIVGPKTRAKINLLR